MSHDCPGLLQRRHLHLPGKNCHRLRGGYLQDSPAYIHHPLRHLRYHRSSPTSSRRRHYLHRRLRPKKPQRYRCQYHDCRIGFPGRLVDAVHRARFGIRPASAPQLRRHEECVYSICSQWFEMEDVPSGQVSLNNPHLSAYANPIKGLAIAVLTIFTRSIFRVAELKGGFSSDLANDEISLMILESTMIAIACICTTAAHPAVAMGRRWGELSAKPRRGVVSSKVSQASSEIEMMNA